MSALQVQGRCRIAGSCWRRLPPALELLGSTRVWLFRNGTLGTVGMHPSTDLEDFFENGDFALHIVGSDGRILRANRAELELLGYSAEEYVGHHIAEFHADAAAIDDMLGRLSHGEKLQRYPARLRAKDGSIRHVQITSSGRFQDGSFVSTRCLTIDVTESIAAQERHQQAGRLWREALSALAAAVYITDPEGRITYFNQAAVELSGRTPQIGSDSWCVTWRLFNLDGTPMPHDECPMAVALKENRPVRDVEAYAERPDGTRVRFQPYPTPLHDEHGKLIGAVNLLVDVTDQREAEHAAARLAAIVVSSNDGIVGKTLDGVVTSWNDAAKAMFGYDAAEMIGQSITRIIPPELQHEEQVILSKLRRGERMDHYETVRVTKDGSRIDVSLSVSPVQDKSGKLIGAAKVARNITQRKRAEEMQRLLLGELNHRVKNTLATVQAIASQTLRTAKSPAEFVPSFLGRVQALAGAHSILTESSWQGAELGALIRSQVSVEGGQEDRITCSGPDILLPSQLGLQLALVLHELGTNARKHGALSTPRGRVSLAWWVYSKPVPVLHLKWTETGGPPIYVEAPPQPGFGTTLIERSMQSIEGGEAHMRFEADGVTWNIRLPLAANPAAPIVADKPLSAVQQAVLDAKADRTGRTGQRILIVEDETLVAMDMAGMLTDAGFEIIGPTGIFDEAMRLVARADFDGVLLDANLGGKRVDELAAALTRRNIPFAFVTGYGRDSLPQAFASAPMVAKPFNASALLRVTTQMLSRSEDAIPIRREERA